MSTTPIPAWMQVEVLQRDHWTCLACGRAVHRYPDGKVRDDTATIDHVVPDTATHRGMTTPDNLQTLCRSCNTRKGSTIRDYRILATTVGDGHAARSDRDLWPFEEPDPSWLVSEPESGYWETVPARYLGDELGWIGVLWVDAGWWVAVFDRDEWSMAPVLISGPFSDFDDADRAHLQARELARQLAERFDQEERRADPTAWRYYAYSSPHHPGVFLTGLKGRCFTGQLSYERPDDAPLRPPIR